jgi:hypothetical protein
MPGHQATLIAEVLNLWREAERIASETPTVSPDHETAALAAARLRILYQNLTTDSRATDEALRSSRATVESARSLLHTVRPPSEQ